MMYDKRVESPSVGWPGSPTAEGSLIFFLRIILSLTRSRSAPVVIEWSVCPSVQCTMSGRGSRSGYEYRHRHKYIQTDIL